MWRLGAWEIRELPLFAASSKMETAPMAGKTWQPSHEPPHTPVNTGTRHTDTQWKAEGGDGREQKTAKRSTHNAPFSRHTDK